MKLMEAYLFPNHTNETVARTLMDCVACKQNVPQILRSNWGANLLSTVMQDICKMTRMKKVNTTAYYPQMDGLVGNLSRTLHSIIVKYSHKFGFQLDINILQVLFAYRMKLHDSTGKFFFTQ